jgi:hypothetical protein
MRFLPRNLHRRFSSSVVLLAVSLILITLAASCGGGASHPTPININLGGASFVSGVNPDKTDRTYAFFVGSNNDDFTLDVTPIGAGPNGRIFATNGDGTDANPPKLESNTPTTVSFAGNVGFLHLVSDTMGPPVTMNLGSVTINSDGNLSNSPQPDNAPTLAKKVWSMPLEPNTPLELFFAASGGPAYFVTVKGLAGKTVDVVLDGPGGLGQTGNVTVNTSPGSWAVGADAAEDTLTAADAGFLSKVMPANLDTLFLGVSSSGFQGNGTLSVNLVSRILTVQARFWSHSPATPAQVATITAAFSRANAELYRITAGRVRIGTLRLYTTYNPAAATVGNLTADDLEIFVTGVGAPPGVTAPLPANKMAVEMNLASPVTFTTGQIAQSLMRIFFGLPKEEPDANGANLCPNSFMSFPTPLQPELCWRGNHNPFGSNGLGAISPNSMWERFGPTVGAPEMTKSPPHLLRNVTTVTVPMTVAINP